MKVALIIAGLIVTILLLDKFHSKLPPPFPQLYKLWSAFSHALGRIMSWIILTIVWVIIFGPYALVWKLTHKKQHADSSAKSYWIGIKETSDIRYQF